MRRDKVLLLYVPVVDRPFNPEQPFEGDTDVLFEGLVGLFYLLINEWNFKPTIDGKKYKFFTNIEDCNRHLMDCVMYIVEDGNYDNYHRIRSYVDQRITCRSLVISTALSAEAEDNGTIYEEMIFPYSTLRYESEPTSLFANIYIRITENDNNFKRLRQRMSCARFKMYEGRMKFTGDHGFSERLHHKFSRRRQPFIGSSGLMDLLISEETTEPVGWSLTIANRGLNTFLHTARQTNHRTHAERFSINVK